MSTARRRASRRISAAAAVPAKTEDYAIRWQPVTNTYTPSADIMSSPDPLNDTADESAFYPPSSRRIVRSQLSSRFGSRSVSRSVSPRKQTFELEVGDNSSPQKLLVTVETDEAEPQSVNTRRKLFQSPGSRASSRVRTRATTTTVPLRDEDEPTTPRRRGRPRKSNGTPIPGAGVKRRAATPMKRTPRRQRSSKASDTDDALSEIGTATPRSTRRGRPPKNKPTESQHEAIAVPSSTTTVSTARGGRRRRQAMDQDELIHMADMAVGTASFQNDMLILDDEVDLVMAPQESIEAPIEELPPSPQSSAPGSDIWLGAAPDEELTPRPSRRSTKSKSASATPAQKRRGRSVSAASSNTRSTPRQLASQTLAQPEPQVQEPDAEDLDFPDLPAAPSDVSSADDLAPADPTAYRNDTIAQGEDFSMIFMDSIPSLQASFRQSNSGPPPVADPGHHELGDETNLIINSTLETLRQEQEAEEEEEEEDATEDKQESVTAVPIAVSEPPERSDDEASSLIEMEVELDQPLSSLPLQEGTREIPVQPPSPFAQEATAAGQQQPEPQPSDGLSPIRAFSASLARSPRKFASPLRHQVLKYTARQAEQADPGLAEERLDEVADIPQRHETSHTADDPSNMYEDSFSEIPQEVLAAATPRRPSAFATMPEQASNGEEDEMLEEPEATGALPIDEDMLDDIDLVGRTIQRGLVPQINVDSVDEHGEPAFVAAPNVGSNVSVASQPETGRLPTPDDTPPHNESEAGDEAEQKSASASRVSSAQPSPMPQAYFETETVTYTASQRAFGQQPALSIEQPGPAPKVTPVNQLSSPVQDNQSLMPEILHTRSARPTLSPIVRAGRVLQSVTSDPPSPESRERQLGSPFRSSASKESKDSRTSRRISMSPPRPFNIPAPRSSSVGAAPGPDDPFRSSSKPVAQSGFLQALRRSVGSGAAHRRTISQESLASSIRHAPPSEEMSWVANEGPISPRLRGDNTLTEVAQSSLVGPAREQPSKEPAQLDGPADEVEESEPEPEEEVEEEPETQKDDETDIWEFEASRTTPRSTRQQPFGRKAPAPILRRGTIPSPWVRPGDSSFARAQREASPELHTDGRAAPSSVLPGSEPDEFSLLAEQRREEEERARANQSPSKGGKFDLSSFFSSPAALPGMLAAKTMSLLRSRQPAERTVEMEEVPESPIPARIVAPVVEAAVESVLSEAPVAEADDLPAQQAPSIVPSIVPSTNLYPKVPQQEFQPSSSPRRDLFSPVRPAQRDVTPEQPRSESPEAPEEVVMPVVAQKQNFTPRPRQASQSSFQVSSAVQPQQPPQQQPPQSAASGARTPPRMQLSHEDIANWRQQTTTAGSDDSPGFRRPLLRPLPHKNASPTKSSLRSPLKPHTPGRVVEFTSSVLSPMEQAQVRQQTRGSILGSSLFGHPPLPQMQAQPAPRHDKENDDQASSQQHQEPSDVSMTDASPLAKSPVPPPLSQTLWTREHWLLLDELLQLRRQGPFHGDYEHSAKSEKLVGKTVRSQGEAMKLERWHMDCVDAFRMEVGEGWDEGVLAKRLFALVLGEERRAMGVQEKQTRVMFH